ncbi:MAG: transporter related protein [Frankiales bacterium]|nr:transporter related protein [Frankiales bacterium]
MTATLSPPGSTAPAGTAVISCRGLCAGYGAQPVVRDLDLDVQAGEVLVLLGPNGSGKTTTIMTLAGELAPLSGTVELLGQRTSAPLHQRARAGLSLLTEERSVLMSMSVLDNLRLGKGDVARALEVFPELEPHLARRAGLLSGGQQQMLALARALARQPKVLLADELSLGLAPLAVQRLFTAVRAAADTGVAVLLVEQHVSSVLGIADRGVLLVHGDVVLSGTTAELKARWSEVEAAYLTKA